MKEAIPDVKDIKFTNKLSKHPLCLSTFGGISVEIENSFNAIPNAFVAPVATTVAPAWVVVAPASANIAVVCLAIKAVNVLNPAFISTILSLNPPNVSMAWDRFINACSLTIVSINSLLSSPANATIDEKAWKPAIPIWVVFVNALPNLSVVFPASC